MNNALISWPPFGGRECREEARDLGSVSDFACETLRTPPACKLFWSAKRLQDATAVRFWTARVQLRPHELLCARRPAVACCARRRIRPGRRSSLFVLQQQRHMCVRRHHCSAHNVSPTEARAWKRMHGEGATPALLPPVPPAPLRYSGCVSVNLGGHWPALQLHAIEVLWQGDEGACREDVAVTLRFQSVPVVCRAGGTHRSGPCQAVIFNSPRWLRRRPTGWQRPRCRSPGCGRLGRAQCPPARRPPPACRGPSAKSSSVRRGDQTRAALKGHPWRSCTMSHI